jgi:predicted nucleic acid-binding protein
MVEALLDSAVLIDVLRAHAPTINWLATQNNLGVSQAVILELLQGSRDKRSFYRSWW